MQGQDAVSPVIGTLLILAVFAVVTATVALVVRPNIIEYQETAKVETTITQLVDFAAGAKQLAVSGNEGEVKQAAIGLPGGSLQIIDGHIFATIIEYYDYNYSAAIGTSDTDHPRFHIVGDGAQLPLDADDAALVMNYRREAGHPFFEYRMESARYDDGLWVLMRVVTGGVDPYINFDVPLVADPNSPSHTIKDGPWRIRLYDVREEPDELRAEIYLVIQSGFEFRYDGASGSHRVVSENGAVFYHHAGQWKERARGLVQPPSTTAGVDQLTVRYMDMNTTRGDSASGNTRVGALMNLNVSDVFVFEGGAAQVRVQYWGDQPKIWEKHMELSGFKDDDDSPYPVLEDGLTWADERVVGSETYRDAFPVHYTYSRIDVRLRST